MFAFLSRITGAKYREAWLMLRLVVLTTRPGYLFGCCEVYLAVMTGMQLTLSRRTESCL